MEAWQRRDLKEGEEGTKIGLSNKKYIIIYSSIEGKVLGRTVGDGESRHAAYWDARNT